MLVRNATYKDDSGRLWSVILPDNAPDEHIKYGVVEGPPDISSLELPVHIEVRLHNELFHRRLFTYSDLKKRRPDLIGALQAAFSIDIQRLVTIYSTGAK